LTRKINVHIQELPMKKSKSSIFELNKILTVKGMGLHFGNQKRKTAYIL